MAEYKTVLNKETGQLQKVEFGAKLTAETDTITDDTLAKLHDMPNDALITLIKRVSGAMWGIGLMTSKEKAQAMKDRLAVIALTSDDTKDTLSAIDRWLDREEGKPMVTTQNNSLVALAGNMAVTVNFVKPAMVIEHTNGTDCE